jgi:hypothetical protein
MSQHTSTNTAVKASYHRKRILQIDTVHLLLPEHIPLTLIEEMLTVLDNSRFIRAVYGNDGFYYVAADPVQSSLISDCRTIHASVEALQETQEASR